MHPQHYTLVVVLSQVQMKLVASDTLKVLHWDPHLVKNGSAVRDMSTMVLEIQGGSHDGTTNNTLDDTITVGTKNLFGGDSDFPWSPNVTVGKRGVILTPHDVGSGRIYKYDIHVELVTASLSGTHTGGFLNNIKNSAFFGAAATQDSQVDTFGSGESIATFTY